MCAQSLRMTILIMGLTFSSASALPPTGTVPPMPNRTTAILDGDSFINANRILAFATNYGSLFTDAGLLFGRSDGFYYPFTTLEAIQSGQNDKTVVYSAGLWMGGKIAGQTRVALAEYDAEYCPGPWHEEPWPDIYTNPDFRVYKLYSDSLAGNPNQDYLVWPIDQGAPTTDGITPAMIGDQMLWSVFSDAEPSLHNNNAGSTEPLGIEVRMTTWATNGPSSTENDAVYVKYLLYNKGGNQIDGFYIGFWTDPDLGWPGDDLVGCDTLNGIFYCYNGTENDAEYGSNPPSWGGRVISGPVVPSPGDTAMFNGQPLADHRNLRMTSCMAYINGWDPASSEQSYNCLKGLLRDGTPYDPGSGPTRFMYAGDPILNLGDIDHHPSDRRLMIAFGPLVFAPGDSQQVVLKIGARQAGQHLLAIERLKSTLLGREESCCINPTGDVDCSLSQVADITDLTVLIDHLFISHASLCCSGEGEIDNTPGVDIGDLQALVAFLFSTFGPPLNCP